jgi:Zn-dependent metalloprotease
MACHPHDAEGAERTRREMFMNRTRALRLSAISFALGVSIATAAFADVVVPGPGGDDALPIGTQRLLATYPGAHAALHSANNQVTQVYGMPMSSGATAAEAVQSFLQNHIDAFGISGLDVSVTAEIDLGGKFTSFDLAQFVDNTPVEYGLGRILVLHPQNGDQFRVVYAGGHFANPKGQPLAEASYSAQWAMDRIKAMPAWRQLTNWSDASLVVYYGEGDVNQWVAPVRAWKFTGTGKHVDDAGEHQHKYTFFINAATGQFIHARNEILHVDVQGSISGWATPGTRPDWPSNPETVQRMGQIRVAITGGSSAFADLNGNFVIPNPGSTAVDVNASTNPSQFFNLVETGGTAITVAGNVVPPGPINLILNDARTELGTAQVNAQIHAVRTRNYYRTLVPGRNLANIQINTSVSGTCNAFYNGNSINFYRIGGGCANTSYSTVVAHEYGHHIVNQLGLAQGAFGEGFSDTMAIMIYDVGIIGEEFLGEFGGAVRNPEAANQQFPCSSAIHTCGQVLGGFWREFRNLIVARDGTTNGLTLVRRLHADYSNITAGGEGTNAFHPNGVIQVLTVDDNDGNINNGTPNFAQVCNAAAQHGITCPALSLIQFSYPNGRPVTLVPGQPTQVRVDVTALGAQPVPGTGEVLYSINGAAFVTASMAQGNPNQYTATIPAQTCLNEVRYYFRATATGGTVVSDPSNAPTSAFAVTASNGSTAVADTAFEAATNEGWQGGAIGDTATTGQWVRVDPNGTAAQPEDDRTPAPGVNAWVTGQGVPGGGLGDADVDGGFTTLVSPTIDLAGAGAATVSYWRWFDNTRGGAPAEDTFLVDVSNNNGTTWTRFETVGPASQNVGGWINVSRRIDSVLPLTNQMRFRFIAQDLGTGSLVEAGIDDFNVTRINCAPPCAADWNADGTLDFFDYLDFVADFDSSNADFNGDATTDFFDYLDFVAAYDAGC